MTTAVAMSVIADDEPDWVVIQRLMYRRPVGDRAATTAEIRIAAWLLLDLGFEPVEAKDRLALRRGQIAEIARLRRLAGQPDCAPGPRGGHNPAAARELAPSVWERAMTNVPVGITRS